MIQMAVFTGLGIIVNLILSASAFQSYSLVFYLLLFQNVKQWYIMLY